MVVRVQLGWTAAIHDASQSLLAPNGRRVCGAANEVTCRRKSPRLN